MLDQTGPSEAPKTEQVPHAVERHHLALLEVVSRAMSGSRLEKAFGLNGEGVSMDESRAIPY